MTPDLAAWGTFTAGLLLAGTTSIVQVRRGAPGELPALRREVRRLRERNEQLVEALDQANVAVPPWPRRRRAKRQEREAQ